MNKKISVIVPVYNVEEYIERCVDSIINQTYKNLEIILIDDGSTDKSGNICDAYLAKDSRIKVVHKKNGGLSSARNAGLDIAMGDYIGFVDSDDYIELTMYEKLSEHVDESDIVCCGVYYAFLHKKSIFSCPNTIEKISAKDMFLKVFKGKECTVAVCNKLFSKDIFSDKRFKEGIIHEDVEIIFDLIIKSGSVFLVDIPLYNYFHRDNSITTCCFSERNLDFVRWMEKTEKLTNIYFPEIMDAFNCYYINVLFDLLRKIDLSPKLIRVKFKNERKVLLTKMQKLKKYLTRKNKIKHLLFKFKLYRFVKKLRDIIGTN